MEEDNKDKEVIDLSQMLKEMESETKFQKSQFSAYPFQPKIIQWLIKYSGGLIKNPKQATYVLIGFVLVAILVSLFLVFGTEKRTTEPIEQYLNKPQFLPK